MKLRFLTKESTEEQVEKYKFKFDWIPEVLPEIKNNFLNDKFLFHLWRNYGIKQVDSVRHIDFYHTEAEIQYKVIRIILIKEEKNQVYILFYLSDTKELISFKRGIGSYNSMFIMYEPETKTLDFVKSYTQGSLKKEKQYWTGTNKVSLLKRRNKNDSYDIIVYNRDGSINHEYTQ